MRGLDKDVIILPRSTILTTTRGRGPLWARGFSLPSTRVNSPECPPANRDRPLIPFHREAGGGPEKLSKLGTLTLVGSGKTRTGSRVIRLRKSVSF